MKLTLLRFWTCLGSITLSPIVISPYEKGNVYPVPGPPLYLEADNSCVHKFTTIDFCLRMNQTLNLIIPDLNDIYTIY